MNNSKRTFNPLLGKIFRYSQAEDVTLKYQGNWNVLGQALADSDWAVEDGEATLASETFVTSGSGTTSVLISCTTPGENTISNTVTFADGQIDSRLIKLKVTTNDFPNINYDYGLNG